MKIAFITGARSDYGPFKSALEKISKDKFFELDIIVHGMHLLKMFGNSIIEVRNDNYGKIIKIKTIKKNVNKCDELSYSINLLYKYLKKNSYELIILVGDRLETYAAALATHFVKIPILHYGGGHFTKGAVDNIYRYNITNLSKYHLTTSKEAYERLKSYKSINENYVYFTGSPTVDAIKKFLKRPDNIDLYIPELKGLKYVLMTFHPVTLAQEPIVNIMKSSIEHLIRNKINILITYPNNDEKSKDIIDFINTIRNKKNIYIKEHLGSKEYFSAIHNAEFVVGNSSSGVVEVPYFKKHVINIGSRQTGRACDRSVINIKAEVKKVLTVLSKLINKKIKLLDDEELYGNGTAVKKSIKIIKKISKLEI